MQVLVPPGMLPGMQLRVQTPAGEMAIVVPSGVDLSRPITVAY
jgi:hypothetical protein